jgi:hypothetical protein
MHEASKLVKKDDLTNLLLLHIPLKQCAERLQLSYNTVRKYASEPEFLDSLKLLSSSIYSELIEELKHEKKSMAQRMLEASDKALERLEQLVASQQEGIALKACDSILDRNSETARNKKIESDISGRITLDPLMLLHAAATAQEIQAATKALPPSPPNTGFEQDASKP